MARQMKEYCTNCKQECEGKGVLKKETEMLKDWRWVCENCNMVSEIIEVKKPKPKPPGRRTFK